MSDDKKEEGKAKLPNSRMMKNQMVSDAWRDAMNAAKKQSPPPETKFTKKEPEVQFEPDEAGNLKPTQEMNAGGVAGFQAPLGEEEALALVRELIKKKMKEVVRKAPGGAGYTLYAPNKGKKGKPRQVGHFPTKLGAKRAELARFPPKDPGKLKRLRKEVDRLLKDPKKASEREKKAREKKTKKESLVREAPSTLSPFGVQKAATTQSTQPARIGSQQQDVGNISTDPRTFIDGLKKIPKDKIADRQNYIQKHLNDPKFMGMMNKQPNGTQVIKQLTTMMDTMGGAKMKPGASKIDVGSDKATTGESVSRSDFLSRSIIASSIKKSLVESLFREEKTESEWDDYITKLSKNALAGDSKFQNLQKNISRKTEGMLNSAFNTIKKAVGKNVTLKNFGIKHDSETGQTYLAFSASFDDLTAEPIYIHVEGGVPKIDLSQNAKVALTKADPSAAKLFRAELVTVQERVLDEMDDISKAIQSRDKYLDKLQNEVDGYVAGLSPLQISLLKQLLVKKYRKIS